MKPPLLEVQNLRLSLAKNSQSLRILHDITFSIAHGEILGLVGESGCGKSMTASAILGLLPLSHSLSGEVKFEGQPLSPRELSSLRGNRLSLILQDPSLALNPLIPIGKQLTEGLCYHKKMNRTEADRLGMEWLHRVGIGDVQVRMRQYPHELSGGMKQRILIAMALICKPSLVIADEPTTALDVTIQAQILDLLQELQSKEKMSLLFITHDLGVVARICQRVMIMYAGQVVETGPVNQIFHSPQHPYTQALLQVKWGMHQSPDQPLACLKGHLPRLSQKRVGCPFAPRCSHAMQICARRAPPLHTSLGGEVLCWLPNVSQKKHGCEA